MIPLHFHLGFVALLANHRNPLLTDLFLGASAIGQAQFYVALIMLIYVAWDKRLAVRLTFVVLFTMAVNDLLKNLIANPRPFVREGTYLQKWAVSAKSARLLAAEYSTPSGHAMGAAGFYSYLYAAVKSRWLRGTAVMLIVLIGFSRPYLGVHYGEDVLLGWGLGILIAWLAARYTQELSAIWSRLPYALRIATAVAASFVACLLCVALNGWRIDEQLSAIVAYGGFLTGVVMATPLELKRVAFDPQSGGAGVKAVRFLLAAVLLSLTLAMLSLSSKPWVASVSAAGFLLQYFRNAAAAFVGMYVAPWLFVRLKLAEQSGVRRN